MDINIWAGRLIEEHMNPTVKFVIDKSKPIIPDESKNILNARIEAFASVLCKDRVEIRSKRSLLKWNCEDNIGELKYQVGSKFRFMGFQNKNGKYIFPEEALFLVEINKVEIIHKSLPLTVEAAYSMFITNKESYRRYKLYRKLALPGFEIKRISTSDEKEPAYKKIKLEETTTSTCNNNIEDILSRLRKVGPQPNGDVIDSLHEYSVVDVKGSNIKEYNVHFLCDGNLDPSIGCTKGSSNIYSTPSNEDILFSLNRVELPILL